MHKTAAWPLSQAYAALIVYASLFPFSGWHDQNVAALAFLFSPLPRYWTQFDVAANVLGYVPLGFLIALAILRHAGQIVRQSSVRIRAVFVSVAVGATLSLALEATQNYLPARVPSNVDFALNTLGALLGAVLAASLERWGMVARWSRFRQRWFDPEARGALVLLALWPFALLFPAAVPMGLGHVFERAEREIARWLTATPFLDWLPVRTVELQPLVPAAELICVALGAWVPCLLASSITPQPWRRVLVMVATLFVGVGATALSAALTWGPVNAWAWLSTPVRSGLLLSGLLCTVALMLPPRSIAAVALLALVVHLSMLNQAPESAYFAQTLQTWEQGRFIRFHGLAQWLGWLWPYVVLIYLLLRLSQGEPRPRIRT